MIAEMVQNGPGRSSPLRPLPSSSKLAKATFAVICLVSRPFPIPFQSSSHESETLCPAKASPRSSPLPHWSTRHGSQQRTDQDARPIRNSSGGRALRLAFSPSEGWTLEICWWRGAGEGDTSERATDAVQLGQTDDLTLQSVTYRSNHDPWIRKRGNGGIDLWPGWNLPGGVNTDEQMFSPIQQHLFLTRPPSRPVAQRHTYTRV